MGHMPQQKLGTYRVTKKWDIHLSRERFTLPEGALINVVQHSEHVLKSLVDFGRTMAWMSDGILNDHAESEEQ